MSSTPQISLSLSIGWREMNPLLLKGTRVLKHKQVAHHGSKDRPRLPQRWGAAEGQRPASYAGGLAPWGQLHGSDERMRCWASRAYLTESAWPSRSALC
jgi:hypothetical protein